MINMANTTKKLVNLPEVVVEICGRPYNYFMTDSKILMNGRLAQIGCRELRPICPLLSETRWRRWGQNIP